MAVVFHEYLSNILGISGSKFSTVKKKTRLVLEEMEKRPMIRNPWEESEKQARCFWGAGWELRQTWGWFHKGTRWQRQAEITAWNCSGRLSGQLMKIMTDTRTRVPGVSLLWTQSFLQTNGGENWSESGEVSGTLTQELHGNP